MPYNSGTGAYERRATTVIDATPDGDTVAVAIDVKLDQGIDDYVVDLNHHKTNGNHYPATSVHTDSRFLDQSPAGVVSWKDGVPAADAALKDFSNVASGAIPNAKLANEPSLKDFSNVDSGAIAPEKLAWTNFPRGRNLIINGDFRVNQRAYVSGTNTTGANQYTLDCWRVVTSGQNITFEAYLNGNQVTAQAGGIEQVIEDLNIEGGAYVLNWVGTATAEVNGTAVAKGASFTLPAKTNATVKFVGGTVARVQLEFGQIATPFESPPLDFEKLRCQRFFYAPGTAQFNVSGYSPGGGDVVYFSHTLPAQMRITPTISATWGSGVNATPIEFRFPDLRTLESGISAPTPGACSAVLTINSLSADF